MISLRSMNTSPRSSRFVTYLSLLLSVRDNGRNIFLEPLVALETLLFPVALLLVALSVLLVVFLVSLVGVAPSAFSLEGVAVACTVEDDTWHWLLLLLLTDVASSCLLLPPNTLLLPSFSGSAFSPGLSGTAVAQQKHQH